MPGTKFTHWLEHEKRVSGLTLRAYKQDLSQFEKFLCDNFGGLTLINIREEIIKSWVVDLMNHEKKPSTIHRKLSSLRTFYNYCREENLINTNPVDFIETPKQVKSLVKYLETEKMDYLLDQVEFGDDWQGKQEKLIIELLYGTGLRLSELLNLKWENIEESQLKVMGKGKKERLIPLNKSLKRRLKEYRTEKKTPIGFVFITPKGNKLYPMYVYRLVKKYLGKVSSLSKRSPHVLRHTFATQLLNKGADINAIKELLGHSSLSATEIYTHNSIERLKKVYKGAHPKAD